MNMMGQVVFSGKYASGQAIDMGSLHQQGIVVVTLSNGGERLSRKVLLR
jgi:hypothetical protein